MCDFAGFPFVGNYLQLGDNPPEQFVQWSKKYGKTISVRLGSRLMVIIHDYDTAKEIFSKDNTTGRDQELVLEKIFHGKGINYQHNITVSYFK